MDLIELIRGHSIARNELELFDTPMITDNALASRFELIEQNSLAYATYFISGNVVSLLHVETDPALRGQGTAGRLMEGLLGIIRERGTKVRPVCGYAKSYIHRHPVHADLMEADG
jgi:uncharacterized protein